MVKPRIELLKRTFIILSLSTTYLFMTGCNSDDNGDSTPLTTPQPTMTPTTPTVSPTPPATSPTPGEDPTMSPTPTPTPTAIPAVPENIQTQIFEESCVGCHKEDSGFFAQHGLSLETAELAYEFLVNIDSKNADGEIRVIPGNADSSYIIKKLEGADGIEGGRMPLGSGPLSPDLIQLVKDWINDLEASSASSSENVQIIQVEKNISEDSIVYTLTSNAPLQAEWMSSENILVSQKVEGHFSSVEHQNISIHSNNNKIDITVTVDPSSIEGVEILLNPKGIAPITDTQGRVLDGDKDDLEGGVYIYQDNNPSVK